MSVKKEPSGRRSIQLEVEVPGTPEEVWQAIATGPGISSWLVPAEFEVKGGKPVAIKMEFGPGMESTSPLTAWDPPHKWASQSDGWVPGSPPIANEWSIEARGGGMCVVRIVQSLFASTDDWDNQLEGAAYGLPAFLRTLRLYLTHFRGQRSTAMKWMVPVAGTEAEAWEALITAVGVKGVSVGQRWTAPAGVPPFSGVVEYITESPYDALLRLDKPGPGIAALGAVNCGGPSMVGVGFYLYGDQAPATAAQEMPLWEAWFRERFPMAGEGGGRGGRVVSGVASLKDVPKRLELVSGKRGIAALNDRISERLKVKVLVPAFLQNLRASEIGDDLQQFHCELKAMATT